LSAEEYLAIISLDYSRPSSRYEAEKILRQYINIGKYYEWYISRVLQKIIARPPDTYKYIEQYYQLCCSGFTFLGDLGLNYGLRIIATLKNYSSENWYELTPSEQTQLIDSFYPDVAQEAKKVLRWFRDRQIAIVDRDEANNTVNYLDNRSSQSI